jgi:hypothetical protein
MKQLSLPFGAIPPLSVPLGEGFQLNKEESSVSETGTLIGYSGRTLGREE